MRMIVHHSAVFVAACLLIAPLVQCKRGFLHSDEALFNQHFQRGTLTQDSYAEVAISAPPAMKSSCVNQGSINDWSQVTEVTVTAENANNLQQACGTESICVVPKGVTVELRQNLNVAALRVEGSLLWTDDTQKSEEQWLCAGYATVEKGGTFLISITSPNRRAWVYIKANGGVHSRLGERVFGGIGQASGPENEKTTLSVIGRPLERTWSLLAEPGKISDNTIKLMHSPEAMGWRVGDRIVIAPTTALSTGMAGRHRISGIRSNNVIEVTPALGQNYRAEFVWQGPGSGAGLLSAEVINMQRNVVITGDDFSSVTSTDPNIETSVAAFHTTCRQRQTGGSVSKTCTVGLHTVMAGRGGMLVMQHARVEKCGQRGVFGHYCVHMHYMGQCQDCLVKGNAIEFGMQRGITAHQTHLSTIQENVLNDIRGAHIYIEDGNEMYNNILYNVAICPWPLVDDDGKMEVAWKGGCTIPGTDNPDADTASNQAGIWAFSSINHLVGNRFANSFNGMLYQGLFQGRGRTGSPIADKVCTTHSEIGRLEGNTFHGHGRFGTYFLNWIYPRHTDQSLQLNGEVKDMNTCSPYKADGSDNGRSLAIKNQVDYGNAFVGFYDGGDIQFRNQLSVENNNLIYWKATKNFADGCAAHVSYGQMARGNLGLPDHQTFIIEHTVLQKNVDVEVNHHCGVGPTGALCFPTYVIVNTTWGAGGTISWNKDDKTQTSHNNNGGVFTLPPNEESKPLGNFFPPGFVSLVSDYHQWLLHVTTSQGGKVCVEARTLGEGMGAKYGEGILCRKPLRAIRIFAKESVGSQLHVKFYQHDNLVSTSKYDMWTLTAPKRGYAFPVIANDNSYRYELSLDGWRPLPTSWVVEFSDTVIGNRWTPDTINLSIQGRTCVGNKVTSQHDRHYLHAPMTIDVTPWNLNRGVYPEMWGADGRRGHGACNGYEDEKPVVCSQVPELKQGGQCEGQCGRECKNGWCDCGTKQCVCNPGFTGASCEVDLSASTRCGAHGYYSGQYLGGTAPPTARACVCEPGFSGPLCDQNPCKDRGCGHGSCVVVASTELAAATWRCECEEGYSGDACERNCNAVCSSSDNPATPFGCSPDGGGPGKPAWCSSTGDGGCRYEPPTPGSAYCCFANCPSQATGTCDCEPSRDDCHTPPVCRSDNSCSASLPVADGTPCNSVVGGVCTRGICSNPTQDTNAGPETMTTTTTTTTTSAESATPTHGCPGPYPSDFPECEGRIQWMLRNWNSPHYTGQGVDGSRCSIQQYLSNHEKYCPPVGARPTTTTTTAASTTTTTATTTTTSPTTTTTTTTTAPTSSTKAAAPTRGGWWWSWFWSTTTTTTTTAVTTSADSATPTHGCPGPYPSDFPECEGRIQWMLSNWNSPHYTDQGVDGSRCSIQQYLSNHEKYCPPVGARPTTPTTTAASTTTTTATTTTTSPTTTTTTTTTAATTSADSATPVHACPGPYPSDFPECEGHIQWMLRNWNSPHYTDQGVDGSRCSIQQYLSNHEKYCPPVRASSTMITTNTVASTINKATTTTTSPTTTTTTTTTAPTSSTKAAAPTRGGWWWSWFWSRRSLRTSADSTPRLSE